MKIFFRICLDYFKSCMAYVTPKPTPQRLVRGRSGFMIKPESLNEIDKWSYDIGKTDFYTKGE